METNWVHINKGMPERGQANLIVWCGWAEPAIYLPTRGKRCFFTEPAAINPIFHITHWRVIDPPK